MKDKTISAERPAGRLLLPGLVVTPDWLAENLEEPALRLLDVRPVDSYAAGHIPGAQQVELVDLTDTVEGVPGMVIPADPFAARMSRLGVDETSAVVLYDDNWGMPAARILWALARYGHHRAAVLTGGADRWQQEGRPWTTGTTASPPARFVARPDERHDAPYRWLLDQPDRPDLVLLDTRAPGEYAEGHLPGAIRWDWINAVPLSGWDVMRPAEELAAELAGLGVTPDKEVVTYCRSGVRAAHTYLVLRQLGYPRVRLYDGSWLEWSRKTVQEVSLDYQTQP